MAEFPALPLWTDAYLGDTMHLTLEQHGAYLKLLMIAWRSTECALPDDDAKLARMLGVTAKKWASIRPEVEPFFSVADGFWRQKKLTETRRAVEKKSEDNRAAAERRWATKPLENNNPTDANAYANADANANANAILTKTKTIDTLAKANEASPVFDPLKVMFDAGVALLTEAGKKPDAARALLGKWRQAHGAEAVIAAISRAKREGAVEPVSFIEGALRQAKKPRDDGNYVAQVGF